MIGDDVEVTVVDIRGDKVRLGINAPKQISVHRKEVYDAIRRENHATAAEVARKEGQDKIIEPAKQPIIVAQKIVETDVKELRLTIHRAVDSDRIEDIDQGMKLFKQLREVLAKAA